MTVVERSTLPNLIIIGSRKSGTTSLHGYLGQHPDVFMSKPPELHFFDNEDNWAQGLAWYASFFESARDIKVRGEKTPMYSTYPHCTGIPERVKSVVPDAKLIYLMRNPVMRIRSQFVAAIVHGVETLPFEPAVIGRSVYADISRYAMQIELWLKHFDRDQMLLLTSEQLWSNHSETMADVFRFLDVDPDFVPDAVPANVTKNKIIRHGVANKLRTRGVGRAMRHLPEWLKSPVRQHADKSTSRAEDIPAVLTPELRETLSDLLRSDVERLKQYMPDEFDAWGIA